MVGAGAALRLRTSRNESRMVLLWHFRVPVSGLPRETRMSHVRVPREMSCPAFRVIKHFLPGTKRTNRTHGQWNPGFTLAIMGCH
jgi:hypothetical protein